jgi:fucose permease
MRKTTFYKILAFIYLIGILVCIYFIFTKGILFIIPLCLGIYRMYEALTKSKLI